MGTQEEQIMSKKKRNISSESETKEIEAVTDKLYLQPIRTLKQEATRRHRKQQKNVKNRKKTAESPLKTESLS